MSRQDMVPPSSGLRALLAVLGAALLLAGCAAQPDRSASLQGTRFDPRLGVSASERVIQPGEPVPHGGGSYLTGRPYVIAGRSYVPRQNAEGYAAIGTASWYGDAFHGRRTANGEIFDKGSVSAAHPTLPLPSYVRVTNMGNGRSMIVRVNDRGPYHGGRVMDVSQRVAETLDFRRAGTARVKVEYIGRAGLAGGDDEKLVATLRTDGGPAQMPGFGGAAGNSMVASLGSPAAPAAPLPTPQPPRVARLERGVPEEEPSSAATGPLPPPRPFDTAPQAGRGTRRLQDRVADRNANR